MRRTLTIVSQATAEAGVRRTDNPAFDISGMHHLHIADVLFTVTTDELRTLCFEMIDVLNQVRLAEAEQVNVPLFNGVAE